jgi:hypothetical protein
MKEADLRDVFNEASTSICTLTAAAFAEILSPAPSNSSGDSRKYRRCC